MGSLTPYLVIKKLALERKLKFGYNSRIGVVFETIGGLIHPG
jgi:hypothetical protein